MANSAMSSSAMVRCVEPVRRMVGGSYGWAVHRFPIRGGITWLEAARTSLTEEAARPSYFSRLLNKESGDGK